MPDGALTAPYQTSFRTCHRVFDEILLIPMTHPAMHRYRILPERFPIDLIGKLEGILVVNRVVRQIGFPPFFQNEKISFRIRREIGRTFVIPIQQTENLLSLAWRHRECPLFSLRLTIGENEEGAFPVHSDTEHSSGIFRGMRLTAAPLFQ